MTKTWETICCVCVCFIIFPLVTSGSSLSLRNCTRCPMGLIENQGLSIFQDDGHLFGTGSCHLGKAEE